MDGMDTYISCPRVSGGVSRTGVFAPEEKKDSLDVRLISWTLPPDLTDRERTIGR